MASGVPLDTATAQDLIRKLVADREAYLESVKTTHQLLIAALAQSAAAPSQPTITEAARRTTTASLEVESIQRDRITGSTFTGDDSEEEESASIFVQVPLAPDVYSLEGFRTHLRAHKWTDSDFQIIGPLLKDDSVLSSPSLFPVEPGPADDRSHLSHYSIFDVGADGAPLEIRLVGGKDKDTSRAMAIWNRLKSTNEDPNRESPAVGRITIVREPSPLLFAALHYTMNEVSCQAVELVIQGSLPMLTVYAYSSCSLSIPTLYTHSLYSLSTLTLYTHSLYPLSILTLYTYPLCSLSLHNIYTQSLYSLYVLTIYTYSVNLLSILGFFVRSWLQNGSTR